MELSISIQYEESIKNIKFIISLKPEERPKYYQNSPEQKLHQTLSTLYNNIGSCYYSLDNFLEAFKFYCLSLSIGYWFQPYDTFSSIWYRYTGILPIVTKEEALEIVHKSLNKIKISDIKDWFQSKRILENNISNKKQEQDIFANVDVLFNNRETV